MDEESTFRGFAHAAVELGFSFQCSVGRDRHKAATVGRGSGHATNGRGFMRAKKALVFPTFSLPGEVIKSEILGLFHAVPLKNIEIIDFITSLTHGAIGKNTGSWWDEKIGQ